MLILICLLNGQPKANAMGIDKFFSRWLSGMKKYSVLKFSICKESNTSFETGMLARCTGLPYSLFRQTMCMQE